MQSGGAEIGCSCPVHRRFRTLYGDLQLVGKVHVDYQIIKRTNSDVVEVEAASMSNGSDYDGSLFSPLRFAER